MSAFQTLRQHQSPGRPSIFGHLHRPRSPLSCPYELERLQPGHCMLFAPPAPALSQQGTAGGPPDENRDTMSQGTVFRIRGSQVTISGFLSNRESCKLADMSYVALGTLAGPSAARFASCWAILVCRHLLRGSHVWLRGCEHHDRLAGN